MSLDTIKEYFIELAKSLNGVSAYNILNYDETNLTDDPGWKKILIKRGCKYSERVLHHTKASVSIMMADTAMVKCYHHMWYIKQLIYMILGSNMTQKVLDITGRHLDGLMEPLLRTGCKIWLFHILRIYQAGSA